MNLQIKKTLKSLDFLLNKRIIKTNKYFLLLYTANTQKILLKSKDIYFYTKNKYPLILIKFTNLEKLVNFIKIKDKFIVLVNNNDFIYKNCKDFYSYIDMPNMFIFLIKKNLVLFKTKFLILINLLFFKNFKFYLTNK